MPGPHCGIGALSVADRRLGIAVAVFGVVVAAAPPATTTRRANIRMASFIVSNPLLPEFEGRSIFHLQKA
jgi:hypothetical protein